MLLIGAGLIIPAYILLDIDQYLRIITRNRVSNAHVYGVASFVGIRLSLVACGKLSRANRVWARTQNNYDDAIIIIISCDYVFSRRRGKIRLARPSSRDRETRLVNRFNS